MNLIDAERNSVRYGLDDLTPSREILKLYRELGGTIITIGSDSHKEDDVGCKISYVKNELKELGYKEFCTYKKMEPIFHCL